MNISYNWLKDYLDFDLTPEEVSAALTSIGLETGGIEEVQAIKGGLEGLVIGKVLTCVDHPNSDHLHITTVDLGDGTPTQIVCGAPNVAAGQHVVVATVGAVLYDGEDSFTIKKSKIRGEESFGMICAEDEIGIGTSHDGIIVLPDTAVPGTPAKDYYNVKSDYILEVDITPNRIDAASHYGVARDLAAYLIRHKKNGNLRRPSVDAFKVDVPTGGIEVEVLNTEACPRYAGVTVRNVKVQESPEWLQQRLLSIGLRPINNIVDITNYLLHSMAQPLHCFDLKHIKGGKVFVKTLPEGSKFVTLDETERTLSDKDLMICNAEEGMCIAGVFGGLKSGVTDATTDVFLEAAYFNPMWVRKTARRHGLNTDSSFRFERGVDPNNTLYVLKLAALMVKELAGGQICGDVVDIYPEKINNFPVTLSYDKINTLVGKVIPEDIVKDILRSLEIEVLKEQDGVLELSVPTYRVDVQRDVDVIEDILRIYGYNNVEFTDSVHSNLSYKTFTDESHQLQNLVSEQLTGCGFYEIMNNSLTCGAYYDELVSYPRKNSVALLNPLSNDLNVMRQTLLFGGLESLVHNINRRRPDLRFYEIGNCYYYNAETDDSKDATARFREEKHLGLWLTGNRVSGSWAHADEKSSVFELKAYVENIFARLGIEKNNLVVSQVSDDIFPAALCITNRGGKKIGMLGLVSNKILKKFDIEAEVSYAELNWDILMKMSVRNKVNYTELPKFLPVKRDLALLVDHSVTFAEIEKVAFDSERKLLKEVYLFDVYEGKNLDAGKKSYAVSFILQDENKTLTDKQIEAIMNKIIMNLEQKLNARLR
ncbi:phenylalanine--tRNA ligase subunit beta [Barnesiella propionica]|uniref:phenylalanine--tRNA ligase subunit beta n=1 Tax=Barnesiella propionica TaxID=2981781 RepID=UPI0011CB42F6|nr:phenylalanine--tRNA ligase subunit beta [Barnesiella propionica]MCU6769360.1 phenylalanine--tRNA ligase subunit beta [Barnesiella propionica]